MQEYDILKVTTTIYYTPIYELCGKIMKLIFDIAVGCTVLTISIRLCFFFRMKTISLINCKPVDFINLDLFISFTNYSVIDMSCTEFFTVFITV